MADTVSEPAAFTRQGMLLGIRRGLPLAVSVFAYGIVFGVLARQAGLGLAESTLMSALVYAGSAQFVALDLWATPLPVASIVLATLVVNARLLLMGAALQPWFARLPASRAYGSVFFLSEESWALALREFAAGRRDAAILPGAGLALFVAWVGATVAG